MSEHCTDPNCTLANPFHSDDECVTVEMMMTEAASAQLDEFKNSVKSMTPIVMVTDDIPEFPMPRPGGPRWGHVSLAGMAVGPSMPIPWCKHVVLWLNRIIKDE